MSSAAVRRRNLKINTHTETNTAWLGARFDSVLLDHFQELFHPILLYFRLDDDTNWHSRKRRVYVRPTGLRRTGYTDGSLLVESCGGLAIIRLKLDVMFSSSYTRHKEQGKQ
jgi:hypothetical protein